jgi:hypothetical protein
VTERTGFRLVLEQRNGYLNDHARTSCHESMIIATCTGDRAGRAPGDRAHGPVPSRLALVNLAQSSGKPTLAITLIAVATGSAAPPYRKPRGRWRGSRARQQPGVHRACVRRDASEADVTSITMQFLR